MPTGTFILHVRLNTSGIFRRSQSQVPYYARRDEKEILHFRCPPPRSPTSQPTISQQSSQPVQYFPSSTQLTNQPTNISAALASSATRSAPWPNCFMRLRLPLQSADHPSSALTTCTKLLYLHVIRLAPLLVVPPLQNLCPILPRFDVTCCT